MTESDGFCFSIESHLNRNHNRKMKTFSMESTICIIYIYLCYSAHFICIELCFHCGAGEWISFYRCFRSHLNLNMTKVFDMQIVSEICIQVRALKALYNNVNFCLLLVPLMLLSFISNSSEFEIEFRVTWEWFQRRLSWTQIGADGSRWYLRWSQGPPAPG